MRSLYVLVIAALVLVGCGEASIHIAASRGDVKAIDRYLGYGEDVNAKDIKGWTPLNIAAATGHKKVAEFLIEKAADVNADNSFGSTPLHAAALNGHKEIVELLTANGASVNAKKKNNMTPLHTAASQGRKEIAEVLIANGANVNARDHLGTTPLHAVSLYNIDKIVDFNEFGQGIPIGFTPNDDPGTAARGVAEVLIANGANVHARDDHLGWTPLHFAAGKGIAELLIAKGSDMNAKGKSGDTPLHAASFYGRKEVVEMLISNRIDVNLKDFDGETPLDYAVEEYEKFLTKGKTAKKETADLIRKHGGKTGEELEAEGK